MPCKTKKVSDAFDASNWICLAEMRDKVGLDPHDGTRGKWLACGHIPRSMIEAQVVLHGYQRRPHFAHSASTQSRLAPSIRWISPEQQEEHTREQIARNRLARENSRSHSAWEDKDGAKQSFRKRQTANNLAAVQSRVYALPTESPRRKSKRAATLMISYPQRPLKNT